MESWGPRSPIYICRNSECKLIKAKPTQFNDWFHLFFNLVAVRKFEVNLNQGQRPNPGGNLVRRVRESVVKSQMYTVHCKPATLSNSLFNLSKKSNSSWLNNAWKSKTAEKDFLISKTDFCALVPYLESDKNIWMLRCQDVSDGGDEGKSLHMSSWGFF